MFVEDYQVRVFCLELGGIRDVVVAGPVLDVDDLDYAVERELARVFAGDAVYFLDVVSGVWRMQGVEWMYHSQCRGEGTSGGLDDYPARLILISQGEQSFRELPYEVAADTERSHVNTTWSAQEVLLLTSRLAAPSHR